jgi:hypothetical protein
MDLFDLVTNHFYIKWDQRSEENDGY